MTSNLIIALGGAVLVAAVSRMLGRGRGAWLIWALAAFVGGFAFLSLIDVLS